MIYDMIYNIYYVAGGERVPPALLGWYVLREHTIIILKIDQKQAWAELGQAQHKLGLDFSSINLNLSTVLLYLLSRQTFPFTPI